MRTRTLLIVLMVAVAVAFAAVAMRTDGGLLSSLGPMIHGH